MNKEDTLIIGSDDDTQVSLKGYHLKLTFPNQNKSYNLSIPTIQAAIEAYVEKEFPVSAIEY